MLPIALKSFHIKNYRGIIDTQVDNIPADTQWIFLTGENGFGKTSVLQALASAISMEKPEKDKINFSLNTKTGFIPKYPFDKVNDEKYFDYFSEMYGGHLSYYGSRLIAYGSTRLRISAGTTQEVAEKYSSTDSLFSNDTLLINVEEYLKDWVYNYHIGFLEFQEIFKSLLPGLDSIDIEFDNKIKKSKVKYHEKDFEGNTYKDAVEFLDLAAGYKNIIAMVGDMVMRLFDYISTERFSDLEGIVIIDEIDLHLHPKYQKLLVQKLTKLFPKIQFIVSTHSPIPLLGAPENSVIINVSRTREEGIKAELLDIDFSVLTPNAILSSPIFGFQDLIPESKSDDKMIRTEDTFQEVEFNDQLKKNINQFLTKERQEELLKLIKVKQS
ncbi:MAG: AAA family ATPase [Arcicella sp.]|nr:AAA family ATPase [Arcicella sp.]